MANTTSPLLPKIQRKLSSFGERLMLARKRRGITAKQMASRAGMSAMTLRNLENGQPGVTMGAYIAVLHVLGMADDLDTWGVSDKLGRELQDSVLLPSRVVRRMKDGGTKLGVTGHPFSGRLVNRWVGGDSRPLAIGGGVSMVDAAGKLDGLIREANNMTGMGVSHTAGNTRGSVRTDYPVKGNGTRKAGTPSHRARDGDHAPVKN